MLSYGAQEADANDEEDMSTANIGRRRSLDLLSHVRLDVLLTMNSIANHSLRERRMVENDGRNERQLAHYCHLYQYLHKFAVIRFRDGTWFTDVQPTSLILWLWWMLVHQGEFQLSCPVALLMVCSVRRGTYKRDGEHQGSFDRQIPRAIDCSGVQGTQPPLGSA